MEDSFYTWGEDQSQDRELFIFSTDKKNVITVYFGDITHFEPIDDYPIMQANAFEVGFYGDLKTNHDPKIFRTIQQIISSFINRSASTILLFFCDDSDGKQSARARLFTNWSNWSIELGLTFMTTEFDIDGHKMHVGILVSKTNHLHDKVIEEYQGIATKIMAGK